MITHNLNRMLGLLPVAVVLMAASCTGGSRSAYGGLHLDSLVVDRAEHLFGDPAKPAASLTARLTYVKQASVEGMADAINRQIIDLCIGPDYLEMHIDSALTCYVNGLMNDYHEDIEPLYKDYGDEDQEFLDAAFTFEYDIHGEVTYCRNNLLVYSYLGREYTGGAHGMYYTYYTNIDLRTLQAVSLESLLKDDTTEQLTDLLWDQLMAQTGTHSRDEVEELGYCCIGELEPTENFYLGPDGITFHYNVYEITPYIMGAASITVPWPMLVPLLKDGADIVESVR